MKPLLHDCLLEDILEFSNGKSLPNSFYDANAKYPVWGSNGIIAHCDKFLTIESVIVIGRVGAYCGSLNLVDGANWVTDNAIYAIPKPGNDIRFLYYLLISLDISRTAIGSAQPLLTQSGLKAIKCKIPPLETQREIAHILGTLDDKIELNRKISKTMEEMAQTLYKHWFIDFEFPNEEGKPYKTSGGEMIDSELGPIPKGWRVGTIEELGRIVTGKTPSTSIIEYYGNDIPFITIPDMHNSVYITKTKKNLSKAGADSQINQYVPKETICVSCIATLGHVSLTSKISQTNQQINSIIPGKPEERYFVYMTARNLSPIVEDSVSGGSVFSIVSKRMFSSIQVLKPSQDLVGQYCFIVKGFFEMILSNQAGYDSVDKQRQLLMKELMGVIEWSNQSSSLHFN